MESDIPWFIVLICGVPIGVIWGWALHYLSKPRKDVPLWVSAKLETSVIYDPAFVEKVRARFRSEYPEIDKLNDAQVMHCVGELLSGK